MSNSKPRQDESIAHSGSSKIPELVNASFPNSPVATEYSEASKVEFNYKYPVIQADGSVIIETNFEDRQQRNKNLMIARNCEVPIELKQRGRLPDAVDQKIQYRRCRPGEPFFVRQGNYTNYNGEFVGEEQIHAMPDVERSMNHVREMLFKRNKKSPDQSAMILAGKTGELNALGRRDYGLGFTLDQNGQTISGSTTERWNTRSYWQNFTERQRSLLLPFLNHQAALKTS